MGAMKLWRTVASEAASDRPGLVPVVRCGTGASVLREPPPLCVMDMVRFDAAGRPGFGEGKAYWPALLQWKETADGK